MESSREDRGLRLPAWKLGIVAAALSVALGAQVARKAPPPPILDYIKQSWKTLTRSNRDLAKAAVDPKFHALPNGRWPSPPRVNRSASRSKTGMISPTCARCVSSGRSAANPAWPLSPPRRKPAPR